MSLSVAFLLALAFGALLGLGMRQVMMGLAGSTLAPKSAVAAAIEATMQRREVQARRFDARAVDELRRVL